MKQAVILAGGKGTRLKERLGDLPKPLIDLCGKPLLQRQMELLLSHQFTDVLILVNHNAQQIIDFCNTRNNWGINVRCIDDGEPLGTAGAVLSIHDRLFDDFLVMYGDTMLDVDLTRFYNFHASQKNTAATIFLHPNDHPVDSDLVEIDDHALVRKFHPYPHDDDKCYPNLVNAALYYLRRIPLAKIRINKKQLDFGKDLFPWMLENNHLILGYNSFEYIKDCGTPQRIDKVSSDFLSGRIERARLDKKQAAVFLDRDGTINYEVNHLAKQEDFILLPGVGSAIKALNNSELRTIVVTNQPVIARGGCTTEELRSIHNKMETLLGAEGAYIDRIYYCPHHPDKGFPGEVTKLKVQCNCRKPSIGMIEAATKDLNIDIKKSWIIGDSTADILLGNKCGLRSILVETGFAGLDQKYFVEPNFTVPDLKAAVDFLLTIYPMHLDLFEKLELGINEGDFVFIGGLSRSGKSNFANSLKEYLNFKGVSAVVLSVDRWLRDLDERGEGVFARYHTEDLITLLSSLDGREGCVDVSLPFYNKIVRRRIPDLQSLKIKHKDVVILEGTISLELMSSIKKAGSHGLYVQIDEVERHKRVLNEYRLRRFDEGKAGEIYQTRMTDEIPFIESTAKYAQKRISLNQPPRVI